MLNALVTVAIFCAPPTTSPTTPPPVAATSAAAIKLFDGTSLAGWKPFVKDGDASKTWTVKDGTLICAGNPIGYIATEKEYTNFELTLEWRFDAAKGAGNSGVLLRVQQPDEVWPKSIEAQLESKSAGDIWNIGNFPLKTDTTRTQGRRTVKLHDTNEKPLGEWNRYRIVLNGGTLELYVNDLLQNTGTDAQVVAGRIALQSEGAHIEFRNIMLTPLDGSAKGK